jgi:hypothetical protein
MEYKFVLYDYLLSITLDFKIFYPMDLSKRVDYDSDNFNFDKYCYDMNNLDCIILN